MRRKKENEQSWEEQKSKLFTSAELAENDLRVAMAVEVMRGRRELKMNKRQLAKLAGVRVRDVSRVEEGDLDLNLETILKILVPLGKTLGVISNKGRNGRK